MLKDEYSLIFTGKFIDFKGFSIMTRTIYSNYEMNNCLWNVYTIYEMIEKKTQIQEAMELRAINLILQNIIGDKTFIY